MPGFFCLAWNNTAVVAAAACSVEMGPHAESLRMRAELEHLAFNLLACGTEALLLGSTRGRLRKQEELNVPNEISSILHRRSWLNKCSLDSFFA